MADNELVAAERETRTKAAKAFVNELRKLCGERAMGRFKKGYPSPMMNPVALGLECVGVCWAWPENGDIILKEHPALGGRVIVRHAPDAAQWLRDYNAGQYPELVIPATLVKIKYHGDRKATVVA